MPAACLYPAVIVCFRRTAGFFPQEAYRVFGLSVNRGCVKVQQFLCWLSVQVYGKALPKQDCFVFFFFKVPSIQTTQTSKLHLHVQVRNQFQKERLPVLISLQSLSYLPKTKHHHEGQCCCSVCIFAPCRCREKRRTVSSRLRSTVSRAAADL